MIQVCEGESPLKIESKSPRSRITAEILKEYLDKTNNILSNLEFIKKENSANCLLLRALDSFKDIFFQRKIRT
jgi:2,3-bisphosphoglycerate-independent phosphoglycerate mutase